MTNKTLDINHTYPTSNSGNGLESGTSGPPTAPGHPPKPKVVTGCVLEYQYVEVTHSAIQLAFGVAGLVIAAFVAHFYITGRTTNSISLFA